MKTKYLSLILVAVMVVACKKEGNIDGKSANAEISLVQKTQTLKSDNGSSLTAVYFAEGEMVAVKIRKDSEPEQKLTAKGTNEKDEPFFGNGTYTWEMMEDGHSGKLTDQSGNTAVYK